MIRSFADKNTKILYETGKCAKYGEYARVALRKLDMINAVVRVDTLRIPPGNRLEKLGGDRKGQYSIRVNDQFRICFYFEDGDAYDVEIVDYH